MGLIWATHEHNMSSTCNAPSKTWPHALQVFCKQSVNRVRIYSVTIMDFVRRCARSCTTCQVARDKFENRHDPHMGLMWFPLGPHRAWACDSMKFVDLTVQIERNSEVLQRSDRLKFNSCTIIYSIQSREKHLFRARHAQAVGPLQRDLVPRASCEHCCKEWVHFTRIHLLRMLFDTIHVSKDQRAPQCRVALSELVAYLPAQAWHVMTCLTSEFTYRSNAK
jgi:hypothetical protein